MKPVPEITDAELAFGCIKHLPKFYEVPEEFKNDRPVEVELFNQLFFGGKKEFEVVPKDGVDPEKAVKAIRAVMASWEPKHEHKEAGVAYLIRQWFKVKNARR